MYWVEIHILTHFKQLLKVFCKESIHRLHIMITIKYKHCHYKIELQENIVFTREIKQVFEITMYFFFSSLRIFAAVLKRQCWGLLESWCHTITEVPFFVNKYDCVLICGFCAHSAFACSVT